MRIFGPWYLQNIRDVIALFLTHIPRIIRRFFFTLTLQKFLRFLFFFILYLVSLLPLPGPGSPGGSPSGFSGELGGLRAYDCPGGFFLFLAPVRLKESSLIWTKFLEVLLAFTIFQRISLQCSLQALEISNFQKCRVFFAKNNWNWRGSSAEKEFISINNACIQLNTV